MVLAGCVPLQFSALQHGVDLAVYPRFSPYSQAVVLPNTLSSIATLDIVPYIELSSGSYSTISYVTGNATDLGAPDILKLSQSSPPIDPNRPFIIRKLKANARYRVFGKAYNTANTLISKDDSSFVDVVVGTNDTPGMATLPVFLLNTPFSAQTSVAINPDGRYEYLKSTLYLVASNSLVAQSQTTRNAPVLEFKNLQASTTYKLVLEAYKLGGIIASTTQTLAIANYTAPAASTVSLTIPYVTSTFVGNGTTPFSEGNSARGESYSKDFKMY
jgi:hypothetical protein